MTADHPDHRVRIRAAAASLGVGVAMLGTKWAAFGLTGSRAILSDALESIVNIAAAGFAVVAVLLNARPPDPKYPYGYGKIAYFSAGFEGGLIALASLAIFYEAGAALLHGVPLRRLDLGFVLILVASVVNLALGWWLIRLGRRTGSLILEADGQHVLADGYTSVGVVVGVGLVWLTGTTWLDPLVAILVGLNILKTGYHLVREAFEGLMDRADDALLGKIVEALESSRREGWIDVHQLRAWRAGDRTFVDFHLVVPADWTVVRLHEAHDRARAILKDRLGPATEIIIHFDPDDPWRRPGTPPGSWSVGGAVRVPLNDEDSDPAGATPGHLGPTAGG